MIKLRGADKADRQTIRKFAQYVFDYFKLSKKVVVVIQFVDPDTLSGKDKSDLLKYHADTLQNSSSKYTITISTRMRRIRDKLTSIGHELVHVKQYVKDKMIDLDNGSVKFKGKIYKDWEYGPGYWFSPFELEAYAYEVALYQTFDDK